MKLLFSLLALAWLTVSPGKHYLQTEDGKPFFWMGNTAWLMPEKLTREDVDLFLDSCRDNAYNVVQIQVCNDVPSVNAYGQKSGTEAYWSLVDYIVSKAADNGIYVAMDCIWGKPVRKGKMDVELASAYGTFLATRYADKSNIVWVIGGDTRGDQDVDIWNALAKSIKAADKRHLMTFHPFGRTSSIEWWNESEWLDFNMFQSGHRRYDQEMGDDDDFFSAKAEDNWRYVQQAWKASPVRPVLDGEPAYEDIPQGLHDSSQPRWQAADCRRYAYWSVFAGACGHTYGHNSIMQFHSGEGTGAYDATKSWKEALSEPGYAQMKYLKALMDVFGGGDRVPAQDVLIGNGERYDRIVATKGGDFILAYTYTNSPIRVDLTSISGKRKQAWWYSPQTGAIEFIGETKENLASYKHPGPQGPGNDYVLIVIDWKSSPKLKTLKSSGPLQLFRK